MLIDDAGRDNLVSSSGTRWEAVDDRVMGGVSQAALDVTEIDGRRCLRLRGEVRLENNGGFVQMALDLAPGGGTIDATWFSGIRVVARGNGERYSVHLRTADVRRPWQSYRAGFEAGASWAEHHIPFASFEPHRIDVPLDLGRLRRIGLVAIGRAFHADLAVAEIAFED